MLRKLKEAWNRRREPRLERLGEEAGYREEAARRKFDQETQKWGGTVSQPKLPERDW